MHELSGVLATAGKADFAQPLPTLVYDVVRHRGHWRILHIGKHSAPHPNQKPAIDQAMKLAVESKAAGRNAVARLNRTDGRIFDLPVEA